MVHNVDRMSENEVKLIKRRVPLVVVDGYDTGPCLTNTDGDLRTHLSTQSATDRFQAAVCY